MPTPHDPPSPSDHEELFQRYQRYLDRLQSLRLEELLQDSPIKDGEPLSDQLEDILQSHIQRIRQETLWNSSCSDDPAESPFPGESCKESATESSNDEFSRPGRGSSEERPESPEV